MPDEAKESGTSSVEQRAQKLLEKRPTRREFLKGLGLGAAAISAVGLPAFLRVKEEKERIRRELLLTQLDAAKTKEEQEKAFTSLTQAYLEEYDYAVLRGSSGIDWKNPFQVEKEKETAQFLLERGTALVSAWNTLRKESPAIFDKNGRLHLEEKKFAVNENIRDFHLALNFLRAKLAFLVESSGQEKELLKEDLQNLSELADLRPEMEIDPQSWIIMPKDWALSLARFSLLLEKNNIPPPQKIVIGSQIQTAYWLQTQALFLNSSGVASASIFHEGGHHISEAAKQTRQRIGLPKESPFPYYRVEFERRVKDTAYPILLKARAGEIEVNELEQFDIFYVSINSFEDFAVSFQDFFGRGPVFRKMIEILKEKYPTSAALLEARYNFMKTAFGGKDFSFEGRKRRPEISAWESERLNQQKLERNPLMPLLQEDAKRRNVLLRTIEGFSDAELVVLIPECNFDYIFTLLQPLVWKDLLQAPPGEIETTSLAYPKLTFELRGKFTIGIDTKSGEKKITLDTEDSRSIEELVNIIPQINTVKTNIAPPEFKYSQETLRELAKIGITPPRFNPWVGGNLNLDNPELYCVHFQFNEKSGQWETRPLDIRTISLHKRHKDKFGKEIIDANLYNPVRLGKQDVVLVINNLGRVHRLHLNGFPIV